MSINDKTAIRRRRFSAATMLVAAGAVAASTFGSTAVANAFPPGWGTSKNYEDCVAKAESISIPGHDANAVKESCCASFFGVTVTNPNTGEVVGCVVSPGPWQKPTAPPGATTILLPGLNTRASAQ